MEGKKSVMVIDDDRANLCITEEALIEYYNVELAISGDQALKILGTCKTPDLILLNIDMPEMDGYKIFKHICGAEDLSGIPVIFLSGSTGNEPELAGLKLGAKDYISKPFDREILLERIRLRLHEGAMARQLQAAQERLRYVGIDEELFDGMTQDLKPIERKVAWFVALGYNNQEISDRLNYALGYVKNLLIRVYDELEIHGGRRELRELVRNTGGRFSCAN